MSTIFFDYHSFFGILPEFNPFDFKDYLKELEDSFIKINITTRNNHYVDFQNPSIKDFLLKVVRENKQIITSLLLGANYFDQFLYCINYLTENYKKDQEINDLIDSIIINQFDNFIFLSMIFRDGTEYSRGYSPINKLFLSRNFLSSRSNKAIETYLLDKFKLLKIEDLFYHDEKKYIKFLEQFNAKLNMDIGHTINKVANNMRWFENVKNFLLLKPLNETKFNSFVNDNKELLSEKITTSIKKDIEFNNSLDNLKELKNEIEEVKTYIESFTNYNWNYLDEEVQVKIDSLEEELDGNEADHALEKEKSYNELNGVETFQEEDLFKIEFFIKG